MGHDLKYLFPLRGVPRHLVLDLELTNSMLCQQARFEGHCSKFIGRRERGRCSIHSFSRHHPLFLSDGHRNCRSPHTQTPSDLRQGESHFPAQAIGDIGPCSGTFLLRPPPAEAPLGLRLLLDTSLAWCRVPGTSKRACRGIIIYYRRSKSLSRCILNMLNNVPLRGPRLRRHERIEQRPSASPGEEGMSLSFELSSASLSSASP